MGGLIISCAALSILCIVLLVQKIILHHRIRKLTEQVDGFNSGTAEMLDVALQEDKLAQLQNGIADSQLALIQDILLYNYSVINILKSLILRIQSNF